MTQLNGTANILRGVAKQEQWEDMEKREADAKRMSGEIINGSNIQVNLNEVDCRGWLRK